VPKVWLVRHAEMGQSAQDQNAKVKEIEQDVQRDRQATSAPRKQEQTSCRAE
jgi:hypothetical protein